MTWQERKAKVRDRYYQNLTDKPTGDETPTTPEPRGSAPSGVVTGVVNSGARAAGSASRSSATSVMGTDPLGTPPDPLESSMPVKSTSVSSAPTTAWMVSPLGFTENNLKLSIVEPNGSLVPGLPNAVHESLVRLATGRSEPVEDVVWQIAQFFVEAEDERAEGTLGECLEFYVTNYCP